MRITRSQLKRVIYRGVTWTGMLLYPLAVLRMSLGGNRRVRVLVYHRVCDRLEKADFDVWSVSPAEFERQMRWLQVQGFRSLCVAEICEIAEGRRPVPARAVCLTFDDGYKNNRTLALPILRRYGFSAIFFLATAYIGGDAPFPWLSRHLSDRCAGESDGLVWQPLDWAEAEQMVREGMEFGSHTATHPVLTVLTTDELHRELRDSREELGRRLGCAVTSFAAPFGFAQTSIRRQLKPAVRAAGYRVAFLGGYGAVRPGDDPLDMRRIPIYGQDSLRVFKMKVRGALDWVGRLQALWARLAEFVAH